MFPPGVDLEVVPSLAEEDFVECAADAEVLLVAHRTIGARELSFAPRVKFIQKLGAGYDNLDVNALREHGIAAAYTPGGNATAVAEHTILLILAVLKRFVSAESGTRANRWPELDLASAGIGDLAGMSVGLVGFGACGRAVAERLGAFGVTIRYTARHRTHRELEESLRASYLPLGELLGCSGIVSLHVPLNDETHHLMGECEFERMAPGSILINTSRGEVVDERALRAALERGHLRGAGLDVLESDGAAGNPFADLPQVIVTPHLAGASIASVARVMQMALVNISRYWQREQPLNLVPGTQPNT
jgi:phosphoglycerate dehydrogenase-like enzyme